MECKLSSSQLVNVLIGTVYNLTRDWNVNMESAKQFVKGIIVYNLTRDWNVNNIGLLICSFFFLVYNLTRDWNVKSELLSTADLR